MHSCGVFLNFQGRRGRQVEKCRCLQLKPFKINILFRKHEHIMLQGLVEKRLSGLPVSVCPSRSSTAPSPDCKAHQSPDDGFIKLPVRQIHFCTVKGSLKHEGTHPFLRGWGRLKHPKSVIISGSLLSCMAQWDLPCLQPSPQSLISRKSLFNSESCCPRRGWWAGSSAHSTSM